MGFIFSNILKKLRKEFNTGMILTTHYMEEASYLCKRIVIMDQGQVLARGTLEELLAEYKNGEKIDFSVDQPIDKSRVKQTNQVLSFQLSEDRMSGEIVVKSLVDYLPGFLTLIENEGLKLTSLECRKMTLDDLFISMTGRHLIEAEA